MIDAVQRLLTRLLRIPPQPPAPAGAPGKTKVFRAAPGFLRYQVVRWAIGQVGAAWLLFAGLLGIDFLPAFPFDVQYGPFGYLDDDSWIELLVIGGFLLQLPLTLIGVFLDYRMRWYIVTDRSLRIREGVVRVREKTMSFANIQNLSQEQGPVQRMLGISDVLVRTAGGGESKGNESKEKGDSMHEGYFRGVDNGDEIKDLVLGRLRRFRDAGLGDAEHREEVADVPPVAVPSPPSGPAGELLAAAHRLAQEARRLNRSVLPLLLLVLGPHLLLLATAAPPAAAQPPARAGADGAGGPPAGPQWSLGVGIIASPEPYVGLDDVEIQPVPLLTYRSGRFAFQGIRATWSVLRRGSWELELLAQARFAGYDADDTPLLTGMEDRRITAEGGVELTYQPAATGVALNARHDLLDRHGGALAEVVLFHEVDIPLAGGPPGGGLLRLTPQVSATWFGADYNDYYYGVTAAEARPGRPAYAPGAVVNGEAGVRLLYLAPGPWQLFAFVEVERLAGEIGDSPIVVDDTAVSGLLGLSYRF